MEHLQGTLTAGVKQRGSDSMKEKVPVNQSGMGVCYCLTPLHHLGSRRGGKKKAVCLFKGAGLWCQGREWRKKKRGEEARRATTQLSDFSSQTEKRHLRHGCQTARKQDYYFILFSIFALQILFLEILFEVH